VISTLYWLTFIVGAVVSFGLSGSSSLHAVSKLTAAAQVIGTVAAGSHHKDIDPAAITGANTFLPEFLILSKIHHLCSFCSIELMEFRLSVMEIFYI
jgi:hypothetical protein